MPEPAFKPPLCGLLVTEMAGYFSRNKVQMVHCHVLILRLTRINKCHNKDMSCMTVGQKPLKCPYKQGQFLVFACF